MGALDGVGLQFHERMSGAVDGADLWFEVDIRIDDLARFLRLPDHLAELAGKVSWQGATYDIRDGRFNLFAVDPRTGVRRMTYAFSFGDGWRLEGHKEIADEPGRIDVVDDMTRLFTTLHRGESALTGELFFRLKDLPALVASMRVGGTDSWARRAAALAAFTSFAYGALRDTYLDKVRLFYDTQYDNLVVTGRAAGETFFLVSGTHDKGFPWGDGELFWDVLLVCGGRRFAITDRVLEGLELDIERGTYRYSGPIFEIADGYIASFSQMRAAGAPLRAEIEIRFESTAYDTVPFPFPLVGKWVRKLSSKAAAELKEALPGEHLPGIHITPRAVAIREGRLRVGEAVWDIEADRSFGECEHGAFRNLKEPTLLYGYLCAVRPERRAFRVQILTRTMRNEPQLWIKDRLDAAAGEILSRMSSAEYAVESGELRVKKPDGALSRKIGEPVLEVNNDHFPTAVFQRRIVEVEDPSGERCLALEEDMTRLRLEAIGCERKAKVAAFRDQDKLRALDRVLEETGFDALVEEALAGSGKARETFAIAIKPNFMFAYDKRDRTTYTDPELVARLVARLRTRGFATIRVVEAQSTYGEYFDRRSVREMAAYLGYTGEYEVVDMTEDAGEQRRIGPRLGVHPVSRAWREADFRISFAKNKTHAYAYYTLTLKNIYGALPLANKFKEYHCGRGIYETAIEYLGAFPVEYGLIDAYLSADGPFGVFADPSPNETHTIVGGADLVAVDWVGASKMGLDPMISPYMRLAVKAFGKPAIEFAGDANPYRPWVNVPVALALFTNKGLDADYHFGNLFYMAAAQMDETHFQEKGSAWYKRPLRWLTVPLRRTFFLRTGEAPSLGNRLMSWLLYRIGM